MVCTFERLLFPASLQNVNPDTYMVAIYRAHERVPDSSGAEITQVKAVGYGLPVSDKFHYDLQGQWKTNSKYGRQFEVLTYDEIITPTKEGVIAYLSSGQIKGIGPVLATRIYNEFGENTLEVLDKNPEKLLTIAGISRDKLEKIRDSYLASRGARDVIAFLMPYGITAKRAIRFYREYGTQAIEIVKEQPYRLCEISGVGFATADRIAMNVGIAKTDPERLAEGLLFTLRDAETNGHLCLEKNKFIKEALKLLGEDEVTEQMVRAQASKLAKRGELVCYGEFVYREETARLEDLLAKHVRSQLKSKHGKIYADLDAEILEEERKLKIKFAPEQREAVKMALTNGLSIVTGGPGTGKTLIQRAILDIYTRNYPEKEIRCCAPTGRAARRMEQSTGRPSMTVHKLLCLCANEDGVFNEPSKIEADLVLVDEVSMLDLYLAEKLLKSIRPHAQLILVGDSDQLPSVGPGAVLSELIASNCVPVVRLDRVFRQASGSRIATNAKLIRHGNFALDYGDDFQLIESKDLQESAKIIERLYLQETVKYGVDNVALLSPYRQKTETGVNALNGLLRDQVNIPNKRKAEVQDGKRLFRVGDKLMQTKNNLDVSNGDIGYIKSIDVEGNETNVQIDFGDGRLKKYEAGTLDMVDWGYATTIHKSQGSEYSSVIINLQVAHFKMLTRPLIYTAITRGKNRVIIVGEKRALCIAINKTDTEKRGTCLAKRIQEKIS